MEAGRYRAVVIGSSLGGVEALQVVLGGLRRVLPVPVLIGHHIGPAGSSLDKVLHRYSRLPVEWAVDGATAEPGTVYLCPSRHELRLEPDGTLTVHPHGRQSSLGAVDALFEAAASALGDRVLAVVLSGSGHDGRDGARVVKAAGGTVLVQDELTALAFGMPGSVAAAGLADLVLPLAEIPDLLDRVVGGNERLPLPALADMEAVFAAGGEMGALMADTDWSRTSLGPVERWSPALRAAVATVLGSRMAMLVCWGPSFLTLYNDAYRALIGSKHPALLGRPVFDMFPEHTDIVGPMLRAVLGDGTAVLTHDLTFPFVHRGAVEEHFHTVSFSPLRDGPAISGVLGAFVDTTARVQAARRLRTLHRLATLDESAADDGDAGEAAVCERAAAVLAENPDDLPFALLYLTDRTGTELHLAGAAGLRAGSPAAPRRLSAREATAWPVTAAVRRREAVLVDDVRLRFPILSAVGPERALLLPAGPRAEGPQPVALVLGLNPSIDLDGPYREFLDLVAEQVGAAVLAARRHQDARDRIAALAALDRDKTEFFAGVSHEFRTPLTLMLLPLEQLLATAAELRPELAEAARLAHRNALRLLKLVNTLLEFSWLEQGRRTPRFVDLDVSALTADAASVFGPAFEQAGVALVVDCPPLGRPVPVDPDMWERVVLNLVSNALKHTFTGTVTLRLALRDSHLELQVVDTGVGIPEAEIADLFTRFHRVRGARSRSHEGSGIGLALVRQLVRMHRGSVRVRSVLGAGSTFTVWLPLAQPHRPDLDDHADQPERASDRRAFAEEAQLWLGGEEVPTGVLDAAEPALVPPGRRPVLLLVDDNADMREYVRRVLAGRYEVTGAADGAQALAELTRRRFDLVLTDVMMPEPDGLELLHRIRADPRLRATPVVLLTALAGTGPAVRGLAAGADDYIVKPFTAHELVARIDAQLELARLRHPDAPGPVG